MMVMLLVAIEVTDFVRMAVVIFVDGGGGSVGGNGNGGNGVNKGCDGGQEKNPTTKFDT